LRRIRLEHAQKLIVAGNEKLPAIAGICGYRNVNSFWVAFKKTTGLSPRDFREKQNTQTKAGDSPLRGRGAAAK
jgi:YesN/AraC family two-component response regulator